jgi:hypothetical protein
LRYGEYAKLKKTSPSFIEERACQQNRFGVCILIYLLLESGARPELDDIGRPDGE